MLAKDATDLDSNTESVIAERLPDHRRLYLDYEGEISGGRGSVRRVAQGEFWLVPSRRLNEPSQKGVNVQLALPMGTLQVAFPMCDVGQSVSMHFNVISDGNS